MANNTALLNQKNSEEKNRVYYIEKNSSIKKGEEETKNTKNKKKH